MILSLVAGCGQTGAPLPPSLELPAPVSDLVVSRIADRAKLRWTMPRRTTDNLLLKGPQPVHICRRINDGPCAAVADVSFPPEKPASYEDVLLADLSSGTPQLLSYTVSVLSRHGRSAGGSNLAYTASGAAPPPFADARGTITANGVVLEWQLAALAGDDHKIQMERSLISPPTSSSSNSSPRAPAAATKLKSPLATASTLVNEQSLVVRLPAGSDAGRALDTDAAFDQRYSYRISRVETLRLSGKTVEIAGPASSEIFVDTKDTFPPHAPTGLAAVATTDEGAVDLSWSPNVETDLAGYAIYRREAEANGEPKRLSDANALNEGPAFRDSSAQPGHKYAYSVVAVDRDGNQSARSDEATETLPPKP